MCFILTMMKRYSYIHVNNNEFTVQGGKILQLKSNKIELISIGIFVWFRSSNYFLFVRILDQQSACFTESINQNFKTLTLSTTPIVCYGFGSGEETSLLRLSPLHVVTVADVFVAWEIVKAEQRGGPMQLPSRNLSQLPLVALVESELVGFPLLPERSASRKRWGPDVKQRVLEFRRAWSDHVEDHA